jgi:histidinol-phosphatase (PHP family)
LYCDYHVHLEEGPYSFNWMKRTYLSYEMLKQVHDQTHSKEWLEHTLRLILNRVQKGSYDEQWLDLYLQVAIEKGLKEVGIVEHLYRFKEMRGYFEHHIDLGSSELGKLQTKWLDQVMTEGVDEFLYATERAKKRWEEKGVRLRVGIEADYFDGGEQELASFIQPIDCDFISGSVHFLNGWGFDNPSANGLFLQYDLKTLYSQFYQTIEKGIKTGLFQYMSHLDNLKVFGHRPDEADLIPHYQSVARALRDHDVAHEMNSGLYYRFPVKEKCPSQSFTSILVEHGVPFTLSSDAHFPENIGAYVHESMSGLKSLGVRKIATFEKKKRIMADLPKTI